MFSFFFVTFFAWQAKKVKNISSFSDENYLPQNHKVLNTFAFQKYWKNVFARCLCMAVKESKAYFILFPTTLQLTEPRRFNAISCY